MLRKVLTFGSVIVAVVVVPMLLQHNSLQQLRRENVALRQQAELASTLRNQLLGDGTARASSNHNLSDLLRLRTEVLRLRPLLAQLENGKDLEDHGLAPEHLVRSGAAVEALSQAKQLKGQEFSKESWTFSGYGTLKDGIQSALWAVREGQLETVLNSCSPEAQKSLSENVWKDRSENEIANEVSDMIKKVSGIKFLGSYQWDQNNANDVTLRYEFQGRLKDKIGEVRMVKIGDQWVCRSIYSLVGFKSVKIGPNAYGIALRE